VPIYAHVDIHLALVMMESKVEPLNKVSNLRLNGADHFGTSWWSIADASLANDQSTTAV